jgi:hypothetical protein
LGQDRIVPRLPESYRRFREAYQRRRFDLVLADGHRLAATLEDSPDRRYVAPVAIMYGVALAERDSSSTRSSAGTATRGTG